MMFLKILNDPFFAEEFGKEEQTKKKDKKKKKKNKEIADVDSEEGDNKLALATLSKDEVFGEIAIFSDKPRVAGAIALVNSDLTMVPKEFIRGKFDAAHPYFKIGLKSLFAYLS